MPSNARDEFSGPETSSAFDFFIGNWAVRHRRLRERLAGCREWVEFDGTTRTYKLLGGQANVDDNVLNFPEGTYRAASLRSYNPAKRLWTIWWLDGRSPGQLDPPVVGKFTDGVGTFFADDVFAGRPIRVRFRWTDTRSPTPRWDQAFSDDGGKT